MSLRIGLLLVLLGISICIGNFIFRLEQERELLQLKVKRDEETLRAGLQARWEKFFNDNATQSDLPETFKIDLSKKADIKSDRLIRKFFPSKPVQADWKKYQGILTKKSADESIAKDFLVAVMKFQNSWDRVLAVSEWAQRWPKENTPELATLSEYEKTLIDPEAKAAYQRIFQQIEFRPEFLKPSNEIDIDLVLYRMLDLNNIRVFVPSLNSIQPLKDRFENKTGIRGLKFENSPWIIRADEIEVTKKDNSFLLSVPYFIGILIFILGSIFLIIALQDYRRVLVKKVSFLNQIVHELKTPLTGLKLNIDLIRKLGPSDDVIQAINQSVKNLDRLFEEVTFIHQSEGHLPENSVSFNEFQNALEIELKDFDANSVQLRGNYQGQIQIDLPRLHLVLRNMISNAFKFGTQVQIEVSETNEFVQLVIRDNGPGVAAKDSKKIFEEFYRSDSTIKKGISGMGLGLSVVKKCLKETGGTVHVKNPGKTGAEFEVNFRKVKQG